MGMYDLYVMYTPVKVLNERKKKTIGCDTHKTQEHVTAWIKFGRRMD